MEGKRNKVVVDRVPPSFIPREYHISRKSQMKPWFQEAKGG